VVRNMIRVLNDIQTTQELRVSLAHVAADSEAKVFDRMCFDESLGLTKKTSGHLLPLSNGTAGLDEGDMWGSFPNWKQASASLATALNSVLSLDEDNILILHGTPFCSSQNSNGRYSIRTSEYSIFSIAQV
jgi:hypothetical protein